MALVELNNIIKAIKDSANEIRPTMSYGSYDFSDDYNTASAIANAFDEVVKKLEQLNNKETDDD